MPPSVIAYPAWTDLFYSRDGLDVPRLTTTNWSMWNSRVIELLRPYDYVVDILQGRITPNDRLYSSAVDGELFVFLMHQIPSAFIQLALEVRARCGLVGSELYRVLRDRLYVPSEAGGAASTSGLALGISRSSQTQTRQSIERDAGPILPQDVAALQTLHRNNWQVWNRQLKAYVSTHELDILTGVIEEGHPSYDSGKNICLFYLISNSLSSSDDRDLAETIEAEYGRKGSKLYHDLKRLYLADAISVFEAEMSSIPSPIPRPSGEVMPSAFRRFKLAVTRAQESDMFTDREIERLVEQVGNRFPSHIRSQTLAQAGRSSLQQYYASL